MEDIMDECHTKHVNSGIGCLVYHGDGQGPCIVCSLCNEYIRPEQWENSCPGNSIPENK